ncbi:MAG: rhomboid family intramembrane serine protease [Gemmatimonadales bacterium]
MFPYKDDNPTVLTPYVTVGIIALTSLVWILYQQGGLEPGLTRSICQLGAIPGRLLGGGVEPVLTRRGPVMLCPDSADLAWYTVVSSVFLHGGWLHLIFNMWFLWVFGNNIEDAMGHGRFLIFYLICGVLAALAQVFTQQSSPVPMVGASGAISGIMGAYLVLYPKVRVHMLVFLGFFITTISVPAYLMLLYWAFLQFLGGVPTIGAGGSTGGVAFMAHLGGFVAGALLIRFFTKPELLRAAQRSNVAVKVHRRPPPWGY